VGAAAPWGGLHDAEVQIEAKVEKASRRRASTLVVSEVVARLPRNNFAFTVSVLVKFVMLRGFKGRFFAKISWGNFTLAWVHALG
jgi:hypothetical protein